MWREGAGRGPQIYSLIDVTGITGIKLRFGAEIDRSGFIVTLVQGRLIYMCEEFVGAKKLREEQSVVEHWSGVIAGIG